MASTACAPAARIDSGARSAPQPVTSVQGDDAGVGVDGMMASLSAVSAAGVAVAVAPRRDRTQAVQRGLDSKLPTVQRGGMMSRIYKVPLLLEPQPEGGFTVTSPILPELVTEGDSIQDIFAHVQDALDAVIEIYEDEGRPLPSSLLQRCEGEPLWFECLVERP